MRFAVAVLLLLSGSSQATPINRGPLFPVILVPGDGGSQIQGRLNKSEAPHVWCYKSTDDWYSLWLNLQFVLPGATDCFADNLKMQYNHRTRTSQNRPGVETRVPGFGNTTGVDYMDPNKRYFTSYFELIIEYLEKGLGYKRNISVRGAPYDFRRAPNEMEEYFKNVRALVEEMYAMNGKRKVVLIAHSLGNLYVLYLLNNSPQEWKDQYIRAHISISAPYGGASKTAQLFASGYNLDIPGLNPMSVREMQRTMPSSAFLLPYDTFWKKDEVLIYGPTRNYTVSNYNELFTDINYTTGTALRKDTEGLIKDLKPPGVPVYCLYGVNVSTPLSFVYKAVKSGHNWFDSQPSSIIHGDGDGTVNLHSALGCKRWIGKQNAPVVLKAFSGIKHVEMLRSKEVAEYVVDLLKDLTQL